MTRITEGLVGTTLPDRRVYDFSKYVVALCVRGDTNVIKLGVKLGIDQLDLLRMINGRAKPTESLIDGLARELDGDVSYLQKLAEVIEPCEPSE
jgi:hypothetical protein